MKPLAILATVFTARRGLLPLVVVLALLSSECAMKAYEGPELPRSEIAVLENGHCDTDPSEVPAHHGGGVSASADCEIPKL